MSHTTVTPQAHPFSLISQHFLTLFFSPSPLLSMSTRPTKQCAHWTTEDKKALLAYLIEHKSEGDSGGFKKATWTAAAIEVNKDVSKGALKTGEACKAKFRAVSLTFPFPQAVLMYFGVSSSRQLMRLLMPFRTILAGHGMTKMGLILLQRRRAPGMTMSPSTQLHNLRLGSFRSL